MRIKMLNEAERKYQREYKQKKREDVVFRAKELEINRKWRDKNTDKISDQKRDYYLNNKEAIVVSKKNQSFKRNLRKVQGDNEFTDFVFKEAKELVKIRNNSTGIKWEVDHVLPLLGKEVSGLHVWNNIAVITESANKRKYNLYVDIT